MEQMKNANDDNDSLEKKVHKQVETTIPNSFKQVSKFP